MWADIVGIPSLEKPVRKKPSIGSLCAAHRDVKIGSGAVGESRSNSDGKKRDSHGGSRRVWPVTEWSEEVS